MTAALSSRFDLLHSLKQLSVELLAINSGMHATVAIRAKSDDIAWIVRAAVAQTANVVRLQVRSAISANKRRRRFATLAMTFRSRDNVGVNNLASLINVHRCSLLTRLHDRRREGSFSQLMQTIGRCFDICKCVFLKHLKRTKFEDDRLTRVSIAIGRRLKVVAGIDHWTFEFQTFPLLLEKKQIATFLPVLQDRFVACAKGHVTFLSLAEVVKRTIGITAVRVAVRKSGLASDDEDHRMLGRRDDAALLLSPKSRMNVLSSIVDTPTFKTPHRALCLLDARAGHSHIKKRWETGQGVFPDFRPQRGTGAGGTAQETPDLTFSKQVDNR